MLRHKCAYGRRIRIPSADGPNIPSGDGPNIPNAYAASAYEAEGRLPHEVAAFERRGTGLRGPAPRHHYPQNGASAIRSASAGAAAIGRCNVDGPHAPAGPAQSAAALSCLMNSSCDPALTPRQSNPTGRLLVPFRRG